MQSISKAYVSTWTVPGSSSARCTCTVPSFARLSEEEVIRLCGLDAFDRASFNISGDLNPYPLYKTRALVKDLNSLISIGDGLTN
jgi:hypothetical protein